MYVPQGSLSLTRSVWEIVKNGGFESVHSNPFLGPCTETLVDSGGKWVPFIVDRKESWRLVTAIFPHAGIGRFLLFFLTQVHFTLNLMCLVPIGCAIERNYGSFRLAAIYLLSGVYGESKRSSAKKY